MNLYDDLKQKMIELIDKHGIKKDEISITTKILSTKEAIGETKKKDFPLLKGKEVLMNANYKGSIGQAFTDRPGIFKGSIEELMNLDIKDNHNKPLFIASLNAILRHLGLIESTIHCKDEGPEVCSEEIKNYLKKEYKDVKIALVGFQPSILDSLRKDFKIRVLDLDQDNIGEEKYGVMIEDGKKDREDVMSWADLVLATGSTAANGSIVDFVDIEKPVFFYGTTVAGVAYLEGLKRLCFCAK